MIDKPGDFPIGSPESRAAARAMLEARMKGMRRLQIVTNVRVFSYPDNSKPHVTPWTETLDGCLMRFIYVPNGTDEETEDQFLATP
jgi:hypothetical protein